MSCLHPLCMTCIRVSPQQPLDSTRYVLSIYPIYRSFTLLGFTTILNTTIILQTSLTLELQGDMVRFSCSLWRRSYGESARLSRAALLRMSFSPITCHRAPPHSSLDDILHVHVSRRQRRRDLHPLIRLEVRRGSSSRSTVRTKSFQQ